MTLLRLPFPIDFEAQKAAIEKELCSRSLVHFIKAAWAHVEHRRKYKHNWHIDMICAHLEAITDEVILEDEETGEDRYYNRLLINVPPGAMKSLLVNVFWPAWEWGPRNMPHIRTICASHSMSLSRRDGLKMRRLVTSEWYKKHWGDRVILTSDQNEKTKFENTFGGFRQACAFENMTGARGDRVIIDDPHSVDSAKSDAERASAIETFEEAVPTRMDDPEKSAIVVIMQRLHEEDVSGVILDRQLGYDHICIPMRYEPGRSFPTMLGYEDPRTEEGELFFPDRFPLHVVERDEALLGQYGTAGQFQQIPVPRGGGIIHPSWWQLWKPATYPGIEYVVLSLDTAYTEKAENDPSAFTVWGIFSDSPTAGATTRKVDRYGKEIDYSGLGVRSSEELGATPRVMLMYAWADRKEFHELVKQVALVAKRMKVDKILIENKAAGHSVAQELRRLFGSEDFYVQMYDPKTLDKVARLYSVQHIFAEGMVYAPDKDWAEMVIRQVATFPKGKHDDLVDTVSMGIKHLRDCGMLARVPEKMKELEEQKRFTGNRKDTPLYAV